MIRGTPNLTGYATVPEPSLVFAGGNGDKHPLRGIVKHGPYSASLGVPARIRLAAVYPEGEASKIGGIIRELRSPAEPREAKNYYPCYPGFAATYRVALELVPQGLKFVLPKECDEFGLVTVLCRPPISLCHLGFERERADAAQI